MHCYVLIMYNVLRHLLCKHCIKCDSGGVCLLPTFPAVTAWNVRYVLEYIEVPLAGVFTDALPSFLSKISPEKFLVSIWLSHDISLRVFIPMIFNISCVIKILLSFLFKVPRILQAVSGKMTCPVAPTTFSIKTVLEEMSVFSAVKAFAIIGVGVFLDHVLVLVGSIICLGPRGWQSERLSISREWRSGIWLSRGCEWL